MGSPASWNQALHNPHHHTPQGHLMVSSFITAFTTPFIFKFLGLSLQGLYHMVLEKPSNSSPVNYFLSLYLGSLMGKFRSWVRCVVCWWWIEECRVFKRKRRAREMPRHGGLGGSTFIYFRYCALLWTKMSLVGESEGLILLLKINRLKAWDPLDKPHTSRRSIP